MSNSLGSLSLVIPCFNEESAIQPVLRRCIETKQRLLHENHFDSVEIIVVDDGSTDLSPSITKAFREIRLLRLPKRLGYGAALKSGFLDAQGDWLAMIDMDATYDPMNFLEALPYLRHDRNHIVIGDRLSQISGMPMTRKIGNKFFVSLIRLLHGKKVLDSCTGFRIFSKDWMYENLRQLPDDLNFSLAMTLIILQKKCPYTEIPIQYATRKGRSKLNIFFHGLEFLWTILRATAADQRANGLKALEENGIVSAE